MLYQVVDEASQESGPDDRYQELAAVLAEALNGEPDLTRQRAEDAGRRWAETQVPVQDLSWEDGTRQVGDVFARLGFAPRVVDDHDGRHVELTACPFREVARDHPQVVCAVHAGLLQGTLSRLGVPEVPATPYPPTSSPPTCCRRRPAAPRRHGERFGAAGALTPKLTFATPRRSKNYCDPLNSVMPSALGRWGRGVAVTYVIAQPCIDVVDKGLRG